MVLQPVTTSWREWSQRCAALATHPAVVESRDFWLETATRATLRVASQEVPEAPGVDDLVRLSADAERVGNNRDRRRAAQASVADRRNPAGRTGPDDRGHGR